MAGRTAARTGNRPVHRGISDAGADHVRELCARAPPRAAVAACGACGCDRPGGRNRGAGAAADLPGRLRLSRVRAVGGPPRARPVHAHRSRSAHRPGVPFHRLAVSAFAVWTAVHAPELRAGAAWRRRRAVGIQGDRGPLERRRGGADRAGGEPTGPVAELGGGVRRPEPGARAARGGRGAQRHVADARAGRRTGAHCWGPCDELGHARRRGGAGRRRRDQGHGGIGAAVSRARAASLPRPRGAGARGVRRPAGGRTGGPAWLRRAHVRLRGRRRRAAAARGDAQHPRRDRASGGSQRDAQLVASRVPRGVPRGAHVRAVAHRAGRELARRRRLEHDRAARVDRVAAAVVCDLGAAASGRQRRSAPARRHAPALRLRHPHPSAACRSAAQPPCRSRRPRRARRCPPPGTPPGTRRFPGA